MLSKEEKAHIRETETFRDEVRQELKPKQSGSLLSSFFKHDAVLLCLGFLLTTGMGSWLTYLWKQRETASEQEKLSLKSRLDTKMVLVQTLTKAVAETHTACNDVTTLMVWNRPAAENKRIRLGGHPKPAIDGHLKTGH